MINFADILPFIAALIFLVFVMALYVANRKDESEDTLRNKLLMAKRQGGQQIAGENAQVFEAEQEKLMELRLDDFFKELSKKKGVSTGYFQKMLAGISAGAALIVLILCATISFVILNMGMSMGIFNSLILSFPLGFALTVAFFNKYQENREKNFLKSFPLAFDVVSRGLKAGSTIEKTFVTVAEQIPGPVGKEFDRINHEIEFGVPFEEALINASERIQVDDFSFFTIALIIQKKAGGSLSELVGNIATYLRKRQELRLKVKSLSAEAKATGIIVGSMPILILMVMYYLDPDTINILRYDATGRKLSVFLIFYMLTGVYVIRKMTKIKV